jgi:hypothetical protein
MRLLYRILSGIVGFFLGFIGFLMLQNGHDFFRGALLFFLSFAFVFYGIVGSTLIEFCGRFHVKK